MRTSSLFRSAGAAAALAAASACADATAATIDPSCVPVAGASEGGQPLAGASSMTVAGHGAYTARFTAELTVRGNVAYTSTWQSRAGVRGTAIMIWDVSGAVPQLVDSVIVDPNIVTTGDVAVSDDGSLLVVATEPGPGNIVVYDLADPRKPR